jgi:predicted CXXCH cytochrome family protein
MKTLNKNSIMVGMLLGSMVIAGSAVAGIAATKHNLGSSAGLAGRNQTDATAEVCVFCHTPHGSVSGAAVPLWNKTLPLASSFETYDTLGTSSLDGKVTETGSVSIACLSCHDGAQAMDVMVNTPGSGTNQALISAGTWSGGNVNPDGTMGQTGIEGGAGEFPMLGQDLKNDHPIGIQYAGGGIEAGQAISGVTDFNDEDFKIPVSKTINLQPVWFLDVNSDGKRQKTDLPLYTRTGVGAGFTGDVVEPFVECASCHDPHTETVTFLRIPNTGSAVCLACHDK